MNIFKAFETDIRTLLGELAAEGALPAGLDTARVTVEPPREAAHGDLSTNAAMVLAKPAGMPPRKLAEMLVERLRQRADVTAAEIAGPGFVNLRLDPAVWRDRVRDVLSAGPAYGDSAMGGGLPVNVEYVSANPTGPLHAAHGRGAVFGDALAALLAKAGYAVTREYYINDAGAQVDVLARSAYLRYREALGEAIGDIPAGLYPGEYLKDVGEALAGRDGDRWLAAEEADWLPAVRDFAIAEILKTIKADLDLLGVRMDVYTSERGLVASGAVDTALASLEERGLIYVGVLEPPKGKKPEDWEPRPQTLFAATRFGDDVDRPLKKSDGSNTYFANDIAYHFDKFRRGFGSQIDVWGADHGGYIKRMQAATTAVTDGKAALDVKICQLVHLLQDGKPVKMSKRAGTFVTLSDVIGEVGKDVVRFIMLTRRNDQTLDFDFAKVTEQSKDNPVFYVQYAHARCRSVLRHAGDPKPAELVNVDLSRLDAPEEMALVRRMATWPRQVESAAEAHEPHRVAFYLYDLASDFHALWNRGKDDTTLRFLVDGDEALTRARLAMVSAVATVIASGLAVMGVEPVEEMRS
ncbi:arginine--tRNA ligase [Azospirillum sp. RWY-5-1]|uniref:Arginine--tRNA ligase n=1 Tax=Azospirillum oleiclasticum TaxID=2735135 RepID=A0ABX2TBV2_9PROT|nr:arginine--tRNA ligase [Azospirillum oleiclasticum]NYZ14248.1 arginine--tRNA ligase [Azospirillum oleiclasticum]NYZ21733.1 arginine--tRNA ligase [Azospirillum oleiclasticum]